MYLCSWYHPTANQLVQYRVGLLIRFDVRQGQRNLTNKVVDCEKGHIATETGAPSSPLKRPTHGSAPIQHTTEQINGYLKHKRHPFRLRMVSMEQTGEKKKKTDVATTVVRVIDLRPKPRVEVAVLESTPTDHNGQNLRCGALRRASYTRASSQGPGASLASDLFRSGHHIYWILRFVFPPRTE